MMRLLKRTSLLIRSPEAAARRWLCWLKAPCLSLYDFVNFGIRAPSKLCEVYGKEKARYGTGLFWRSAKRQGGISHVLVWCASVRLQRSSPAVSGPEMLCLPHLRAGGRTAELNPASSLELLLKPGAQQTALPLRGLTFVHRPLLFERVNLQTGAAMQVEQFFPV
jgi:hypothetical protein